MTSILFFLFTLIEVTYHPRAGRTDGLLNGCEFYLFIYFSFIKIHISNETALEKLFLFLNTFFFLLILLQSSDAINVLGYLRTIITIIPASSQSFNTCLFIHI